MSKYEEIQKIAKTRTNPTVRSRQSQGTVILKKKPGKNKATNITLKKKKRK